MIARQSPASWAPDSGPLRDVRDELPALETTFVVGSRDGEATPRGPAETGCRAAIEDHSRQFETVATDAEDDFQIIYTSGTIGDPKGVRHAHPYLLGLLPSVVAAHRKMDPQLNDVVRATAE